MSGASLRKYAQEWEKNARLDPLYAILSSPPGRGGQWDLEQFFATGREELDRVFLHMADIGALPFRNEQFLDFGCGVGRVCQALCERFSSGLGVDVSARMVELATNYAGDRPIEFMRNTEDNLRLVPTASISFLYSHIVLQHVSNDLQRRFIREFSRVLELGGVAAFQIPIEDVGPAQLPDQGSWLKRQIPRPIKNGLKKLLGIQTEADSVTMEMNVLAHAEVTNLINASGCSLIRLSFSNSCERDHNGRVEFFDHTEAVARIADGRARSKLLSAFYFMRKGT
jgi:SAM-dependent methyltransferase